MSVLIVLVAAAMLCGASQVYAEGESSQPMELPLNIFTVATVVVTVIIIVSAVVLLMTKKRNAVASLIPQA